MIRKTISILLCTSMLLGQTSCLFSGDSIYEQMNTKVIEYMEQKYGDEFELVDKADDKITSWGNKDDPFSKYYVAEVKPVNSTEDKSYKVYVDHESKHEGAFIIGDEYMWTFVEPYLREFIENSLDEYAPCKDSAIKIQGVGSKTVYEQTSIFSQKICFDENFPIISSYEDLEKSSKDIWINVIVLIPDSQQNINTTEEEWSEWEDCIKNNLYNNSYLRVHVIN